MRLLITGTPGVGKTTLARELSGRLRIEHVDVSEYIRSRRLYSSYDEKYRTHVFDERKVRRALSKYLSAMGSFIVDTHCCDVVEGISFDLVFVLTESTETLFKRLKARGYDELKIKENIECEIFGVIKEDAEEIFGDYYTVGPDGITQEEAIAIIEHTLWKSVL
jgi:adenylate kinase